MKKTTTALILSLLALVWLVFLVGGSNAPSVARIGAQEDAREHAEQPAGPHEAQATDAPARIVLQSVAAEGVQIETQDMEGKQVAGADVFVGGIGRRWMDVSSVSARTTSGADGRCSIEPSAIKYPNTGRIVLQKAGYVTAVLEAVRPGNHYVVQLESAARVELRFLDQSGKAVPHIRAWMSGSAIPSNCIGLPGGIVSVAGDGSRGGVHGAFSDSRGLASFDCLGTGDYDLMVDPGKWAIVRGSPHQKVQLTKEGAQLEFTLASPWGCLATVTGDVVLRHKVVMPKGASIANALTGQSLDLSTRNLRAAHPDAIAELFVLAPGASTRVELELIASKKGRLRVPLELIPVDDLREPLVVDLTGYPDVVTSTRVLPRITCPDGSALDGLPMLLRSKDNSIALTTTSGKVVPLPPGSYELRSFDPVLLKVAAEAVSFDVSSAAQSPEPMQVALKSSIQLTLCEIEITGSPETIPAECRIVLSSKSGDTAFVMRNQVRVMTVAPPGPLKVRMEAIGIPALDIEANVETKVGGEVQRVVVDLGK
jgi:hypothetical protein